MDGVLADWTTSTGQPVILTAGIVARQEDFILNPSLSYLPQEKRCPVWLVRDQEAGCFERVAFLGPMTSRMEVVRAVAIASTCAGVVQ